MIRCFSIDYLGKNQNKLQPWSIYSLYRFLFSRRSRELVSTKEFQMLFPCLLLSGGAGLVPITFSVTRLAILYSNHRVFQKSWKSFEWQFKEKLLFLQPYKDCVWSKCGLWTGIEQERVLVWLFDRTAERRMRCSKTDACAVQFWLKISHSMFLSRNKGLFVSCMHLVLKKTLSHLL